MVLSLIAVHCDLGDDGLAVPTEYLKEPREDIFASDTPKHILDYLSARDWSGAPRDRAVAEIYCHCGVANEIAIPSSESVAGVLDIQAGRPCDNEPDSYRAQLPALPTPSRQSNNALIGQLVQVGGVEASVFQLVGKLRLPVFRSPRRVPSSSRRGRRVR